MQPFMASLKGPVPFSVFNLVNDTFFFFYPRVHVSRFLSLPLVSEQTGQPCGQFAFNLPCSPTWSGVRADRSTLWPVCLHSASHVCNSTPDS